jgi:hypothetical protein
MKSQARLRLRQPGRHNIKSSNRFEGVIRYGLAYNLARAFEMNCHPKHYNTGIEEPTYTMDYITGETTWHGPPPYRPHAFIDLTLSETP